MNDKLLEILNKSLEEGLLTKEEYDDIVLRLTSRKLIKITKYEDESRRLVMFKCPHCGEVYTAVLDNYCGNCGQMFER